MPGHDVDDQEWSTRYPDDEDDDEVYYGEDVEEALAQRFRERLAATNEDLRREVPGAHFRFDGWEGNKALLTLDLTYDEEEGQPYGGDDYYNLSESARDMLNSVDEVMQRHQLRVDTPEWESADYSVQKPEYGDPFLSIALPPSIHIRDFRGSDIAYHTGVALREGKWGTGPGGQVSGVNQFAADIGADLAQDRQLQEAIKSYKQRQTDTGRRPAPGVEYRGLPPPPARQRSGGRGGHELRRR